MPTTYTLGDERVQQAIAEVMRSCHEELHAAGVKIGVLMAHNPEGPAVKHHGSPARATIKVIPLKDRLTKGYDAELLIDQAEYDIMRPAHLNALIDHELSHLAVVVKLGAVQRDDLGRPKLRAVPGDWDAGDGFASVVARHGDYASEFENLRRAMARAELAKAEGEVEKAGMESGQ